MIASGGGGGRRGADIFTGSGGADNLWARQFVARQVAGQDRHRISDRRLNGPRVGRRSRPAGSLIVQ